MNWLQLAVGLVKLAQWITEWLNRQKAVQEGHDRAVAEAAKELIKATTVAREIEAEFARKSDEEINKSLEGDFRD